MVDRPHRACLLLRRDDRFYSAAGARPQPRRDYSGRASRTGNVQGLAPRAACEAIAAAMRRLVRPLRLGSLAADSRSYVDVALRFGLLGDDANHRVARLPPYTEAPE